ncbi:hypothetical protein AYI72_19000 [Shewanella algae]|nr:hypothetical protein AYI72_19000 [Shewanella algae]TVL15927.1 hypothetical protein AYJ02_09575 [Shewanella algae]UYA14650.1 hypothetical protein D3X10_01115 [Shewanella algae]
MESILSASSSRCSGLGAYDFKIVSGYLLQTYWHLWLLVLAELIAGDNNSPATLYQFNNPS